MRIVLSAGLLVLSVTLLLTSLLLPGSYDTEAQARRVERRLYKRLAVLESFASRGPSAGKLPPDMVIYRYVEDSLYAWSNQFPIRNDDISRPILIERLSSPRSALRSPLAELPDSFSVAALGYKWYLVKAVRQGPSTLVEGLELANLRDTHTPEGVNPQLGLGERFCIRPLSSSGGSVVHIDGKPCFKVLCENFRMHGGADAAMAWIALLLFLAAALWWLYARRSPKAYALFAALTLAASLALYFWGRTLFAQVMLFSPALYAGGPVLYSLAAVLLLNLAIFSLSLGLYLSRLRVPLAPVLTLSVLIVGYALYALRSIILQSNISLEVYKLSELSGYTFLVYAAFLLLLSGIPLLLASARIPALSLRARLACSLLAGLFLMLTTASLGFRKEQEKVAAWANHLSVERNLPLETQLGRVEERLSSDPLIAALSLLDSGAEMIRNRVSESYLPRISPEYRIRVMTIPPGDADPARRQLLRTVIASGTPLEGTSHFLYTIKGGRASYDGVFSYEGETAGQLSVVLIEIEPVVGLKSRGYARLLGYSGVGGVQMPGFYSYARYEKGEMVYCQGAYAYPTSIDGEFSDRGGYVHFVNRVSDDGALIVISRPRIGGFNYIFSTLFLSILMYLLLSLFVIGHRYIPRRDYFRTRINWVIMLSLTLTLVVMSVVSVIFVYRRNEVNQQVLLANKAVMLQSMVQQSEEGLPAALESVADAAGVDLTLYAPDGKLVASTAGEVFDRLLPGCRMNEHAFQEIVHHKRRYYTQRETLGGRDFISIYAPLTDAQGRLSGVLCSPHTERSYDFVREAVMHLMSILTVFVILLILARFLVIGMLDRIFQPLLEMGRKMERAGRGALETIDYDRDDEISALVKAYNGMVLQLENSRESLAQAERDKAWSGMARQVAHEIKNPLTPMKLQLQRMIRLKEKGGDAWQDKFDEMASVLLEHIDILTETANEFSDFAKLYIQEPVRIDLNRLLEDEIAMFDGREEVEFTYFGLEGAVINGPKPQLTRVFVNLMNNSVQALEGVPDGKVVVSLRKSGREGCYDIVFEDNGPGVSEENRERLFTPNFTTKNGGTGLGLAISKSVLDRCGATITYSRSFTLGGACFTVCYPIELS